MQYIFCKYFISRAICHPSVIISVGIHLVTVLLGTSVPSLAVTGKQETSELHTLGQQECTLIYGGGPCREQR